MTLDYFAVGWKNNKPVNFRKINLNETKIEYEKNLQFVGIVNTDDNVTFEQRFAHAITSLEDLSVNGNNTDIPFQRNVLPETSDDKLIKIITDQLIQELPALTNFEQIRFYIIREIIGEVEYRFYVKAIRTQKIGSRFILTKADHNYKIVDTKEEGKLLPYYICYVEKLNNHEIKQYVFNVQDYEDIFGINASKIKNAQSTFQKFLSSDDNTPPEYKVAGEYTVKTTDDERTKIHKKIASSRRIANALAKYNDAANEYDWENIKASNLLAPQFMQTPFEYDELTKEIKLTDESFDAWVSAITNKKKLGISANEYEDGLAVKRKK